MGFFFNEVTQVWANHTITHLWNWGCRLQILKPWLDARSWSPWVRICLSASFRLQLKRLAHVTQRRWGVVLWEPSSVFSGPPTHKHVHACTANASECRSDIEFNMPWMVCVYASCSGLWLCILFYATEAGRHRAAPSVCSLTLMLPRSPPGVYTQGFDDIIGNIGGFNDRALFGLPGLK